MNMFNASPKQWIPNELELELFSGIYLDKANCRFQYTTRSRFCGTLRTGFPRRFYHTAQHGTARRPITFPLLSFASDGEGSRHRRAPHPWLTIPTSSPFTGRWDKHGGTAHLSVGHSAFAPREPTAARRPFTRGPHGSEQKSRGPMMHTLKSPPRSFRARSADTPPTQPREVRHPTFSLLFPPPPTSPVAGDFSGDVLRPNLPTAASPSHSSDR
jgi:hypothetical protein